MAVEIATAYVNIVPSARGFGRSLSGQIGAGMGQAGASAGQSASDGFGSTFLSGIAGIATKGAAALGAVAIAAGTYGLKIASSNEQAQISFEAFLGSAEKATTFLAELKQFNLTTPFELPELQDAAKRLLVAGVSVDKIIPTLRTLSDVTSAAGTGGDGLKRAAYALQQIQSSGRLLGQDLNQLKEAGVPVLDLLAGATGKTKEELSEMIRAGKLGRAEMEQLFTALETGKGLERFAGLSEKQSESLQGVMSNLKDTLGQGLAEAMAPAIPVIKESIKQFSDVLGPVLAQVGPHLAAVFGSVVQAIAEVLPILAPLISAFSTVTGAVVGALIPAFKVLAPFITQTVDIFAGALTMALQGITPTLVDLVRALAPLLPVFARLIGTNFVVLVTMLNGVAQAFVPFLAIVVEGLTPAFDNLLPAILELAHALLPLFPEFSRLLIALAPLVILLITFQARVLTVLLPKLTPLVTKFAEWATVLVDKLIPAIERVVGWITRYFEAFINEDPKGMSDVAEEATAFIDGFFATTLGPAIKKALDFILAEFDKWWVATGKPWFEEQGKKVYDAVKKWLEDEWAKTPERLETLMGVITKWLKEEAPGLIADASLGMFAGITRAFIDAINAALTAWNDFQLTAPLIETPWGDAGGWKVDTPNMELIPKFARGGRPPIDTASLVGELGPELFVPDRAGTILPNNALGGLNIDTITITGQDKPTDTAFALRSELRWLALTVGV